MPLTESTGNPTLQRYRVTLDLLVDRFEHSRPDQWDWPDLIDGHARLVDCELTGETNDPDDFGPRELPHA